MVNQLPGPAADAAAARIFAATWLMTNIEEGRGKSPYALARSHGPWHTHTQAPPLAQLRLSLCTSIPPPLNPQ